MKYFPIFIDLHGRRVLVVGNGPETEIKVEQLIEAGADVVVVSPEPLPLISRLNAQRKITFVQRGFRESDLDDVWLVYGAAADRVLNERIVCAAQQRRVLYNIVDVTELCAFIMPAIVSRNDLNIAISTSGNSPALAQRVKRETAERFGPEYGLLNDLLGRLRPQVLHDIPDKERRKEAFHRLVNSEVLTLLQEGKNEEAEALAMQLVAAPLFSNIK
jgi:precorrin-2 dehydrogenase/sirohydrochlorin ferrochelatase